jgi:uncharacterized protein
MADKNPPLDVKTYFVVSLGESGVVTTYPEVPEAGLNSERPVNNWDIYSAAKQIVDEFESSILAQKVADTVMSAMGKEPTTVAEKINEVLKERGIKTDTSPNS